MSTTPAPLHVSDGVTPVPICPHPALRAFWDERGPLWCELAAVGGGSYPNSYGVIDTGGLYGRTGLTHVEFMQMLATQAYVDGVCAALGEPATRWLTTMVQAEWDRVASSTPLKP